MFSQNPDRLFLPRHEKSAPLARKILNWLAAACMELHPATTGCGPCGNRMLSLETRAAHEPRPDFPVDCVYTWVDGADPAHAAKRASFSREQKDMHDSALDLARFRDNQELRYSLRALEQYAPWVRSVILVTDAQAPDWLDRSHPKIRIVDHRDIIPEPYLPTFNSHVIEAYLHCIPDLAEHFIYLNDDVFLARPCRKTDFFTPNGLPMAFVDWRNRRIFGYYYTRTPHAQSYFNTLRVLKRRGVATNPQFITAHGPYAQTRRNAADAFAFYRSEIEAFAPNKFRTTDELAMYSHALPLWIYHQKRLVPCDERYYYVQTQRHDRVAYYKAILHSRRDHVPPLFFCINDVGNQGASPKWRQDLRILMEACYPEPSTFEAGMPGLTGKHGNPAFAAGGRIPPLSGKTQW